MREVFDIPISIADLYKAPTIAGLAAWLARQTSENNAEKGTAAGLRANAVVWSALVPIQSSGSAIPLFLMHAVGGGIISYHTLVRYLSAEQPVYALQNLDSGNEPQQALSIEEMAGVYVQAIQTVSPGPYLLAGASMGGATAFEMAVQLKAQGREVLSVILLDTPARIQPHMELQAGHFPLAVELMMFAENIAVGRTNALTFNIADLDPLQPEEQMEFVYRKLQQQELVPAASSSSEFQTAFRALVNNIYAFEAYTPPTYDGTLTILRARDTAPYTRRFAKKLSEDPTFGWQAHCTQPVDVRYVPGDHASMNLEPNVRFTAAELQCVLDEATSRKNSVITI
jgi:thioesterase domain-containing protein